MSTLGTIFRVTLFGESHGTGVGAVVEGVPAGLKLDLDAMRHELARRRPGQSKLTTQRKEEDEAEFLSGVMHGAATGAPLAIFIRNTDVDSRPYDATRDLPRPGHADFTAWAKWGPARDHRGGGPFSARTTAPLVAAGAIARQMLAGVKIAGHVVEIAGIEVPHEIPFAALAGAEGHATRCADPTTAVLMEHAITRARSEGDSVGGVVEVRAEGLPAGWGGPGADGLESELARALLAIPAARGVEFGAGFRAARMKGSEHNDAFDVDHAGHVTTRTNNSGGILGGISTGMPLVARVAFKPTSSLPRKQDTVNLATMKPAVVETKGRHDPCVVPRAVPIVEACVACVLADAKLRAAAENKR
ncbi:MAG: chorismate [Planctomycetota bacterium]|nr:MAG: chorismate [Planctomycetota bacterium]